MNVKQKQCSQADELQERFVLLAVRCLRLADAVPATPAGRHIALQIIRSGTAPAPNYAEARAAESTADFVHKLSIVEKELNETIIWLDILSKSNIIADHLLSELRDEVQQLSRIVHRSIATAKRRHAALPQKNNDK